MTGKTTKKMRINEYNGFYAFVVMIHAEDMAGPNQLYKNFSGEAVLLHSEWIPNNKSRIIFYVSFLIKAHHFSGVVIFVSVSYSRVPFLFAIYFLVSTGQGRRKKLKTNTLLFHYTIKLYHH